MKKGQLLNVLLLVSMGCVVSTSVAVAASSKSANKNISTSHKKTKSARKTSGTSLVHQRQMSEKDITECTKLIDKVAQTDEAIQNEMQVKSTDNTKIAEHLKKNTDVQFFASDDPAAIAHLTGKATGPLLTTAKPKIAAGSPPPVSSVAKPISKLAPNTQLFASDDPKAIAHLTGKITTPLMNSKGDAVTASHQPVTTKQPSRPHPRIELFAPNTPDLEHLEGKSANLASIAEPESVDKSAKVKTKSKAQKKHKKSTHKSEKPTPIAETSQSTAIKSESSASTISSEKSEKPIPKKPDSTAVASETPKVATHTKPEGVAPTIKGGEKSEKSTPKKPDSTAVVSETPKEPIHIRPEGVTPTIKSSEKSEKPNPATESNEKSKK